MHAHGSKGRKFGRERDQRRALERGLMCSLIENQAITTTLARAKEIRRDLEKLITKARKGGLSNRRLIIAKLDDIEATGILMDVVAPQLKRNSGYLRIERTGFRRGDNSEMATISFVDEIDYSLVAQPAEAKAEKPAKASSAKKADDKKTADKVATKKEDK